MRCFTVLLMVLMAAPAVVGCGGGDALPPVLGADGHDAAPACNGTPAQNAAMGCVDPAKDGGLDSDGMTQADAPASDSPNDTGVPVDSGVQDGMMSQDAPADSLEAGCAQGALSWMSGGCTNTCQCPAELGSAGMCLTHPPQSIRYCTRLCSSNTDCPAPSLGCDIGVGFCLFSQ